MLLKERGTIKASKYAAFLPSVQLNNAKNRNFFRNMCILNQFKSAEIMMFSKEH